MPTLAWRTCPVAVVDPVCRQLRRRSLQGVQADQVGQAVHLTFMGESYLGNAEAPHGPCPMVVGVDHAAVHQHMGDCVGAGGVDRGPHADGEAVGGVGPAVTEDVHFDGGQFPPGIHPAFVVDPEGMAFGGPQKDSSRVYAIRTGRFKW